MDLRLLLNDAAEGIPVQLTTRQSHLFGDVGSPEVITNMIPNKMLAPLASPLAPYVIKSRPLFEPSPTFGGKPSWMTALKVVEKQNAVAAAHGGMVFSNVTTGSGPSVEYHPLTSFESPKESIPKSTQHNFKISPSIQKTGEPFICHSCSRRFSVKSNLTRHVKMVHQKLKPHCCIQCDIVFVQRSGLKRHMKRAHAIDL